MKFRKKPVVIEAICWTGTNGPEIEAFGGHAISAIGGDFVYIDTLEGRMTASPGDWIIRGVKGELYPCKPDIFEATYEPANRRCHQHHFIQAERESSTEALDHGQTATVQRVTKLHCVNCDVWKPVTYEAEARV